MILAGLELLPMILIHLELLPLTLIRNPPEIAAVQIYSLQIDVGVL